MSSRPIRYIELLRAGWGLTLLSAPADVLDVVAGDGDPDRWAIHVTRILGVRHLVQAVLSGARPGSEILAAGAWVDGVHAATALLLAAVDRRRARLGATDAALAAVWCGAGWRDATRLPAGDEGHRRTRDDLARALLQRAPGGKAMLRQID